MKGFKTLRMIYQEDSRHPSVSSLTIEKLTLMEDSTEEYSCSGGGWSTTLGGDDMFMKNKNLACRLELCEGGQVFTTKTKAVNFYKKIIETEYKHLINKY